MGMALWFGVLDNDDKLYDEVDRFFMNQLSAELDELCEAIGVEPLTVFFDGSDLEYNLAGEIDVDLPNYEPPTHPPRVSDMNWCDPQRALVVVSALCELLLGNPQAVPEPQRTRTLEEMTTLLPRLEDASAARQKFHLAVIS